MSNKIKKTIKKIKGGDDPQQSLQSLGRTAINIALKNTSNLNDLDTKSNTLLNNANQFKRIDAAKLITESKMYYVNLLMKMRENFDSLVNEFNILRNNYYGHGENIEEFKQKIKSVINNFRSRNNGLNKDGTYGELKFPPTKLLEDLKDSLNYITQPDSKKAVSDLYSQINNKTIQYTNELQCLFDYIDKYNQPSTKVDDNNIYIANINSRINILNKIFDENDRFKNDSFACTISGGKNKKKSKSVKKSSSIKRSKSIKKSKKG